jgi:hypothetical protein
MLPQRPNITVRLPSTIRPGDKFEALITLTSAKEQVIEGLSVKLFGTETTWDRHNNNRAHRVSLVGTAGVVCEFKKTTLHVGDNQFSCKFELKPNIPPSYHSTYYQIQYEVEVHARMSWWPDAKESFLVRVQPNPQNIIGKPQLVSTSKTIAGRDPYIEASLSTNVMHLGGYCVGAVSLGNVAFNKYQKLAVGLVGVHRHQNSGDYEELHHRYTEIQLGTPEEGKSYPFRFQIPTDLMPSFKGKLSNLEWYFEVRATVSRWRDDSVMKIPVALQPDQVYAPSSASREAPPTVGSVRLQSLWKSVAKRFSLQFQDERIFDADANTQISIVREQRSDGLYLSGQLTFTSLHLRLQVQPSSGLGRLFSSSIPIEGAAWNSSHRIVGREPEQVKAFLEYFHALLSEFDEIQLTDETLRVAKKDSGIEEATLSEFVKNTTSLVRSIAAARQIIPAPKELQEGVTEWNQLASSLTGALEKSRMAITGEIDSTPCQIITHWPVESKPFTEILLQVQNPQNTHHSIDLQKKEATALSREATELISQLSPEAEKLTIGPEQISLTFPKIFVFPLALRADLTLLLQLSIALRSGTGPYR